MMNAKIDDGRSCARDAVDTQVQLSQVSAPQLPFGLTLVSSIEPMGLQVSAPQLPTRSTLAAVWSELAEDLRNPESILTADALRAIRILGASEHISPKQLESYCIALAELEASAPVAFPAAMDYLLTFALIKRAPWTETLINQHVEEIIMQSTTSTRLNDVGPHFDGYCPVSAGFNEMRAVVVFDKFNPVGYLAGIILDIVQSRLEPTDYLDSAPELFQALLRLHEVTTERLAPEAFKQLHSLLAASRDREGIDALSELTRFLSDDELLKDAATSSADLAVGFGRLRAVHTSAGGAIPRLSELISTAEALIRSQGAKRFVLGCE